MTLKPLTQPTLTLRHFPSYHSTFIRIYHLSQHYISAKRQSEILYIGITKNLSTRWRNHHKIYELSQHDGVMIHWLPLEPEQLTPQLERTFIQYWEPKLNTRLPSKTQRLTNAISLSPQAINRIYQLFNEYPSTLAGNIYLFFLHHLDNDNRVVVSQDLLAEEMGVTTRTIRTVTKWMEDNGAIERYKIAGSVYAYCLDPLEVSNNSQEQKTYVPFATKTLASVKSNPKLLIKPKVKTTKSKTQTND